ncbi:hypothetical protein [Bosea sp. ANAM02]|nr:hypothetical protein [Bosea sp. ANAM02]
MADNYAGALAYLMNPMPTHQMGSADNFYGWHQADRFPNAIPRF